MPDADGQNLRFILLNAILPEDLPRLGALDLATLFKEGVSTTGSGYGLAIASDFVMHAYGLQSHDQALEGRYLGAIHYQGLLRRVVSLAAHHRRLMIF